MFTGKSPQKRLKRIAHLLNLSFVGEIIVCAACAVSLVPADGEVAGNAAFLSSSLQDAVVLVEDGFRLLYPGTDLVLRVGLEVILLAGEEYVVVPEILRQFLLQICISLRIGGLNGHCPLLLVAWRTVDSRLELMLAGQGDIMLITLCSKLFVSQPFVNRLKDGIECDIIRSRLYAPYPGMLHSTGIDGDILYTGIEKHCILRWGALLCSRILTGPCLYWL